MGYKREIEWRRIKFKEYMSRKTGFLLLILIFSIVASGSTLYSDPQYWKENAETIVISEDEVNRDVMVQFQVVRTDEENLDQDVDFIRREFGIVDVLYNTGVDKKIKLIVEQNGKKYTYDLGNNIEYVKFPLQMGNGIYSIKIYENVTGNKYKKVFSKSGTVELFTPKIVYLNSIQTVNWQYDAEAIRFAEKLIINEKRNIYIRDKGVETITDESILSDVKLSKRQIISILYNYVVENIEYDFEKIPSLPSSYIPDIDATLRDKDGICYDYAALLASMLRSQGIATKLVKGYSSLTDVYHAWNEIYLANEKRWVIVDTTYDAFMYKNNGAFTFEKKPTDYFKEYEY